MSLFLNANIVHISGIRMLSAYIRFERFYTKIEKVLEKAFFQDKSMTDFLTSRKTQTIIIFNLESNDSFY